MAEASSRVVERVFLEDGEISVERRRCNIAATTTTIAGSRCRAAFPTALKRKNTGTVLSLT